jgi:hypothetical protein
MPPFIASSAPIGSLALGIIVGVGFTIGSASPTLLPQCRGRLDHPPASDAWPFMNEPNMEPMPPPASAMSWSAPPPELAEATAGYDGDETFIPAGWIGSTFAPYTA